MSGHTKGPWALLLPHDLWVGRPIDDWAITVDDHDTWICTGPTWDADHSEESAANARLIAAAPELLDIVRTFDGYMTLAGEDAEQDSDNPIRNLRWRAQQAIAKATGAQP